jgi:lipoyl(octanoyl) transferase
MALNVDLDLEPFSRINPCGMRGLAVTDLARLGVDLDLAGAGDAMVSRLLRRLNLRDDG